MAEEQKEQNMTAFVDSTFKIVEIHDELDVKAVEIDKIIAKQEKLIAVLQAANDKDFDDVIQQMKDKVEIYKKGNAAQKYRKQCTEHILGLLQHDDNINLRFALSMLLEALGLINAEGLSIDERHDIDAKDEEPQEPQEQKESA